MTLMMTIAVVSLQGMLMRQISEVKLCRINIAHEMWESYLNYMADIETGSSDDDFLGPSE
jgi:hypothetical protein